MVAGGDYSSVSLSAACKQPPASVASNGDSCFALFRRFLCVSSEPGTFYLLGGGLLSEKHLTSNGSKRVALRGKVIPGGGLAVVDYGGSLRQWRERVDNETKSYLRPEIRRDYPLNLSISLSGGKETNQDSPSNGE